MKNLTVTTLVASALLLGACGNTPDVKDPSKTDPTAAPDTKAADPTAKPADAAPVTTDAKPAATDVKPATTDATPATTDAKPADAPADSKCKDAPKPAAKTAKACMTECSKLDAKSPAGSKCIPPKTACEQQCKTLGK